MFCHVWRVYSSLPLTRVTALCVVFRWQELELELELGTDASFVTRVYRNTGRLLSELGNGLIFMIVVMDLFLFSFADLKQLAFGTRIHGLLYTGFLPTWWMVYCG
jgi:hypothetical protein